MDFGCSTPGLGSFRDNILSSARYTSKLEVRQVALPSRQGTAKERQSLLSLTNRIKVIKQELFFNDLHNFIRAAVTISQDR